MKLQPKILVAEDLYLIALDLENVVEGAGYSCVGPVASISAALASIAREAPDAAILDCLLADQPVDPIAHALAKKNVPFAFLAAIREEYSCGKWGGRPRLVKPFRDHAVRQILAELVQAPGMT